MKRYLFGLLTIILLGCAAQQPGDVQSQMEEPAMSKSAAPPDLGVAPELTNDTWLNVDAPLRLAKLRGKVVLIDMWTFG